MLNTGSDVNGLHVAGLGEVPNALPVSLIIALECRCAKLELRALNSGVKFPDIVKGGVGPGKFGMNWTEEFGDGR
jgi:hypothetical protein